MLVPPPNGMTTTSCAMAAAMIATTSSSVSGYTIRSGRRPRSPRRMRRRSRRLLPYVCTTRSIGSDVIWPGRRTCSSAVANASPTTGGSIESSSKSITWSLGPSRSMPSWSRTNGARSGLSSWVKDTRSSPQPHHFMCCTIVCSSPVGWPASSCTAASSRFASLGRRFVGPVGRVVPRGDGIADHHGDRAASRPPLPLRPQLVRAGDVHRYDRAVELRRRARRSRRGTAASHRRASDRPRGRTPPRRRAARCREPSEGAVAVRPLRPTRRRFGTGIGSRRSAVRSRRPNRDGFRPAASRSPGRRSSRPRPRGGSAGTAHRRRA